MCKSGHCPPGGSRSFTCRPAVPAAPTAGSTVTVPTVFAGPGGQKSSRGRTSPARFRNRTNGPRLCPRPRPRCGCCRGTHRRRYGQSGNEGAVVRRIVLATNSNSTPPGRLDPDGRGPRPAEEHPRADRPAVDHQARRAGRRSTRTVRRSEALGVARRERLAPVAKVARSRAHYCTASAGSFINLSHPAP